MQVQVLLRSLQLQPEPVPERSAGRQAAVSIMIEKPRFGHGAYISHASDEWNHIVRVKSSSETSIPLAIKFLEVKHSFFLLLDKEISYEHHLTHVLDFRFRKKQIGECHLCN